MDIYNQKQRWKIYLFGFATLIVGVSLWYTNIMVGKIAEDELQKVRIWADAIQNRANLVRSQESFFEEIKTEERKRVELWAMAARKVIDDEGTGDFAFYAHILSENTTIPIVWVEEGGRILGQHNTRGRFDDYTHFQGSIEEAFSVYNPIEVRVGRERQYYYYQDSRHFTELKNVLDELVESFFNESVINSANVPVIITDSIKSSIIAYGNIEDFPYDDAEKLENIINGMADKNPPLTVQLPLHGTCHVYYTNSFLLTQLRYFPFIQFAIIGLFLLVAYIMFSTARNAEQNQVWVGMSKETAHQLGTPISSLMAWLELLKMQNVDEKIIEEIQKDVQRLENITARFSKIGSAPRMDSENLYDTLMESMDYMRTRTSKKVNFILSERSPKEVITAFNKNLIGWVLENLFKNAVDAMQGAGTIEVDIIENGDKVYVDISDTGKGVPKSQFKTIFHPGVTSKKRGWGLGLSLSKRIVEEYHKGKIFVKQSSSSGTTFRIMLRK